MSHSESNPRLAAVVVHWRDEEHLRALVAAWPDDERLELLVVDNSRSLAGLGAKARRIDPGSNLGFAGGVNLGTRSTAAPWVLLLNPDARPLPGALDDLLDALERADEVAGLVPALQGPEGESQCRWQLQPLPTPWQLLAQTLFLGGARGPSQEPAAGTFIAQPAAAALVLRRRVLLELGGFDEGFFPAWFEDVDFARRLFDRGGRLRYVPEARFEHAMGSTVPSLGYGRFLTIYYRNLCRYLRLHHGKVWSALARCTIVLGMILRILALPLRRPRRASSRREALAGLWSVARAALAGFPAPRRAASGDSAAGDSP